MRAVADFKVCLVSDLNGALIEGILEASKDRC